MYIYKITHIDSGKCYIGQTVQSSNVRLTNHRYGLNKGTHSNPYLQSAWNKYGKDAFTFEKIAYATSSDKLDALERKFVKKFRSTDRRYGYNIFNGGHHMHSVPMETRKRIGLANKGNTHTSAQKLKWAKEKRKNSYARYIISPTGKRIKVVNIRELCRTYKLDKANVMKLLMGKYTQLKGWTTA